MLSPGPWPLNLALRSPAWGGGFSLPPLRSPPPGPLVCSGLYGSVRASWLFLGLDGAPAPDWVRLGAVTGRPAGPVCRFQAPTMCHHAGPPSKGPVKAAPPLPNVQRMISPGGRVPTQGPPCHPFCRLPCLPKAASARSTMPTASARYPSSLYSPATTARTPCPVKAWIDWPCNEGRRFS